MKAKISMLLLAAILLVSVAGCGSAQEGTAPDAAEPEYTIQIPHYLGEQHIIGRGLVELKRLIEEKSDGRIEVELHLSGTLGASDEENLNLLLNGTAEMAACSPYLLTQVAGVGDYNIYEMPYLYDSPEEMFAIADGPVGQEVNERFAENTNAMVLGIYTNGEIAIINTKHAIHTPEDMHGMNLRTAEAELNIETVDYMGGSPTPLTYSECYTAINQKTIDGIVVSVPLMYNDKFHEVCDYLTLTKQSFPGYVLLIKQEFYDSLPEDLQAVVVEAGREMVEYARGLGVNESESATEAMAEYGVEVNTLTEEEIAVFKEAVQPLNEKYAAELTEGLYDRLMAELETIRSK